MMFAPVFAALLMSSPINDSSSNVNLIQINADRTVSLVATFENKQACEVAAGLIVDELGKFVDKKMMPPSEVTRSTFICVHRK